MNLLDALRWRYATKKYSEKKIPDEKLNRIISSIHLSASSFGMQPYRIFVIENQKLRKELSMFSFNPQVTEASHLLVFAAFDSINKKRIQEYLELIAKERDIPLQSLAVFKEKVLDGLLLKSDEENFNWAAKQAYLALGTALVAAATEKIDATPMEGFNAENFDDLLGFKEKGLRTVVIMSLGYRSQNDDSYSKTKKVRWLKDEFVTVLK